MLVATRRLLTTLTAVAVLGGALPAAHATEPGEDYVIQVEPAALVEVAQDLTALGVDLDEVFTQTIDGFAVELTAAEAELVGDLPGVDTVEAVVPAHILGDLDPEPTAGVLATQTSVASWGLDRLDQASLPLDSRYTYDSSGGAGVRVYVVDTGVSPHSGFGDRLATGYTVVSDGNGTADCHGHGTHVAGTVASTTYGVAKKATIVPVRVADCDGNSDTGLIISALEWIAANHPAGTPGVVNISMGGSAHTPENAAVNALVARGLTVAVAAGNDDSDACTVSPASATSALTVGATDSADARASFSNWGSCVDLFAPGRWIRSLDYTGSSSYTTMSGTSMAAPHVAGVVALVLGAWPAATAAQVSAAVLGAARTDKVSDPAGTVNLLASSQVVAVPAAPANLEATATPTTITATWVKGTGPTPASYTVTLTGGSTTTSVTTTSTTATFTGLAAGTDYVVSATGTNSTGTGVAAYLAVSTAAVPGPVSDLSVGDLTTTTATVRWAEPSTRTDLVAGYRTTLTGDGIDLTDSTTGTELPLSDLSPGTTYTVTVEAETDSGFQGAATSAEFTTVALPSAPADIAVATTMSSVTLSWEPPAVSADLVTGYVVSDWDGTGWVEQARTAPEVREVTLDGLDPGQSLVLRIGATSPDSTTWSADIPATTDYLLPAPVDLTATVDLAEATVTWSDGGGNVAGYQVHLRTGTGDWRTVVTTPDATTTVADLDGLTPGTTYRVRVLPLTSDDRTGEPATLAFTTTALPSAPRSLTATPGTTSVALTWAAPTTSPGAVTGYTVQRSTSAGWVTVATVSGRSVTLTGLSPSTTYSWRVVAVAGSWTGGTSAVVTARTADLAPRKVGSLKATSTIAGQVAVSWTAPTTGGDVTAYKVKFSRDNTTWYTKATTTPSTTKATVTVTEGARYYVRVYAKSGSAYSITSTTVTAADAPGKVSALKATSSTAGTVAVSWKAPSTGGDVTSYVVKLSRDNKTWYTKATTTPSTTKATVSATPGVRYYVRVYAKSGSAYSITSTTVTVATTTAR